MKRIFDNGLLLQYLESGARLKVFARGGYHEITSVSDIMDNATFTAVDIYGKPTNFKYTDIEHLLVNGEVVDMETLERGYEEPSNDVESDSDGEGDEGDTDDGDDSDSDFDPDGSDEDFSDFEAGEGDESPDIEDEPEEIEDWVKPGDYVQNVDPNSTSFRTMGSVIISEGNHVSYQYYCTKEQRMVTRTTHKSNVRRA